VTSTSPRACQAVTEGQKRGELAVFREGARQLAEPNSVPFVACCRRDQVAATDMIVKPASPSVVLAPRRRRPSP